MKISFANPGLPGQGVLAVVATRSGGLSPSAQKLDAKMKGGLKRAMAAARFEGKKGQTLSIPAPAGTRLERALLIGLGKAKDLTDLGLQAAGAKIYSELAAAGRAATVCVDALPGAPQEAATIAAQMAYGARLMSYRFDKYRTKLPRDEKPTLAAMAIAVSDAAAARRAYAPLERIADGVCFTRDLVAEPPNVLYPEEMANRLKGLADLGVKVEVLNVAQMKKLGMGALLGVGQGSTRESRVVVMQWNGAADPKAPPVAFIGKGVTFDTGGISIKPPLNMQDMKWDMGGAGAVGGAMMALAGRKAKVNAVGVVGLVENMPDGNAQRPGDVVTSMSGQTIEIQNTDAEGRLVLADVVWYCKDRFKPRFMVDLATLTGAIIITLGHEMAGMFANDDALAQNLEAAGKAVGEPVWRLPLNEEYDKLIKSDIADMKNIGSRGAGSIIGAQFIQRFVDKTPWAHLDIAGMAWTDRNGAVTPKGGTGYGVRLLDRLVADHYEDK